MLLLLILIVFTLAVILTIITFPVSYFVLASKTNYWKRKGVKGPKPYFFLGNVGKSVFLKASLGDVFTQIYNDFKDEPIVGIFKLTNPGLLIRDPDLVNEVSVKSFGYFEDNEFTVKKKHDPLFGRNPFALKGEEWRRIRSVTTPAFTSGKLKDMYPSLEEIGSDLVTFINNHAEATNGKGCDSKELCTRFSLNNIAEVAFGIKGNCFNKADSEFWTLSKDYFSPGGAGLLSFYLLNMYPFLSKYLPMRFVTKKVEKKLTDIVLQTLEHRLTTKTERKDFLHWLNELRKNSQDKSFTDVDIVAQVGSFFFEGYETSALTMSFALLELASNPEAQTKLRKEVDRAFEENNNKIPFDILRILPYLDAVVNETLRLYPALPVLQKTCTKDFIFEFSDGRKSVTIEKGTPVIISVRGLHHDSKYFQFPLNFIPDRFLKGNKDQIRKYTFLPFGEGPRACLGKRFAELQVKIGIAYVVRNFEVFLNKKTSLPIKYNPQNFLTLPLEDILLDFKKIR